MREKEKEKKFPVRAVNLRFLNVIRDSLITTAATRKQDYWIHV